MPILLIAGFFLLALHLLTRHKRISASVVFLVGSIFAGYVHSIQSWSQNLGMDSLSEAQNFSLKEALFFIRTWPSILEWAPWSAWIALLAKALLLALILACALRLVLMYAQPKTKHRWVPRLTALFATVLILLPIAYNLSSFPKKIRPNSELYQRVKKNFTHKNYPLKLHRTMHAPLRVVVYIGESTTLLNWSLYGYPLSTTPRLVQFTSNHKGLLTFSHVRSTHTHTSLSLLQALSFSLPADKGVKQIYDQKRVALVHILRRLDIPSWLLSTQEKTGTWNMARKILFNQINHAEYANPKPTSTEEALMGNTVKDDKFFKHALAQFDQHVPNTPAVLFLHSYAGHGPYTDNLPAWANQPSDAFLHTTDIKRIYGSQITNPDLYFISAYDNAIRYIDFNLSRLLKQVAADSKPTVFIYFSDHGESAITQAGHDSSRFQHEMTRVPFLIYFNKRARQLAPKQFAAFKKAAQEDHLSTLEQVPPTILRLLGQHVTGERYDYQGIGMDPARSLPPIVVRRLADKLTFIRSHGKHKVNLPGTTTDATDPATTIFLNRKTNHSKTDYPELCYNNANTWSKANRGALVANCLAARLTTNGKYWDIAPLRDDNNGWGLMATAWIAASHNKPLWLDASQVPASDACNEIHHWRRQHHPTPEKIPHHIILELTAKQDMPGRCQSLQQKGMSIYVHVPDDILQSSKQANDWVQQKAKEGWPAHFSLKQMPSTQVLGTLLSQAGSQWALDHVDADDLPWKAIPHLPAPSYLRIDTQWDINTLQ